MCKILDQLLKDFFGYWAKMKIQDGRLAAILYFQSSPKLKLPFVWYLSINVQNFRSIAQRLLWILSKNENPRWSPGGHIGFPISSKIEHDLHLKCTNICAKFQINCWSASLDIERKRKSKMATLQPYWISDRVQNRSWPPPDMYKYTWKFSNWLLKHFLKYWAEMRSDRMMERQNDGRC